MSGHDWSPAAIEARISGHVALAADPQIPRAAVACILDFSHHTPRVLLMKRAVRVGDLWSGHMAMPGGREDPADPALVVTAIRETYEEVGLDLGGATRFIGRLDAVRAIGRSVPVALTITPFVFFLEAPPPARLALGPEAQLALWLPLARAASGELDDTFLYEAPHGPMMLPCWRYEGQVIWGLTYRMLSNLLAVLGDP